MLGDEQYPIPSLVVDAAPLICLAKLEALDVLTVAAESAVVTPAVLAEVTRPQMAYRHPDAVEIEGAVDRGDLEVVEIRADESAHAREIERDVPGLHRGETEVLAVAIARSMPAVIFERRARRVAGSLGAQLVDMTELIVAGSPGLPLTEDRLIRFARLVNMRFDAVAELLERIGSRRLK